MSLCDVNSLFCSGILTARAVGLSLFSTVWINYSTAPFEAMVCLILVEVVLNIYCILVVEILED